MKLSNSILLIWHFLVHIVTGAVLFTAIALVSWGLWALTDVMIEWKAPEHLWQGARYASELLFFLDGVCFLIFGVLEIYTLIRLMIRNMRTDAKPGS